MTAWETPSPTQNQIKDSTLIIKTGNNLNKFRKVASFFMNGHSIYDPWEQGSRGKHHLAQSAGVKNVCLCRCDELKTYNEFS